MNSHTGVVSFWIGSIGFAVFVPTGCTPKNVARWASGIRADTDVGEAAAEFVRQAGQESKVRLVPLDMAAGAEMSFVLDRVSGGWNVRVTQEGEEGMYDGRLNEFPKWAERYENAGPLAGKIVRFYYNGGTAAGYRIVRVESVKPNGTKMLIRGKDVAKDEFRSFNSDKIQGDVVIVH